LLELKEETPLIEDAKEFKTILYKNLSYSYIKNKTFLRSINFEINKNDFIGIYGSSGSGKSTLIKLLCGLLKPDEGTLTVDNVAKNKEGIHNYFSYVPQDPFLLNENIIKNISFSMDENNIDIKRIKNILEKVGLIDILGDKINDPLGENGIKISGGQKQRIAIARALYFNKKVIVLDESTSNLDPNTEEKIINLLKDINKMVTIIFVSHKQKSLLHCNKLFEIKNNEINRIK
jgi:ABC-type bacteriocin/lantibiotic exporter with double-glycine peptidase domain